MTKFLGANLVGGAFGSNDVYGVDYIYPNKAFLQYFRDTFGVRWFRFDFKWHRMQPTINGALNSTELGRLKTLLKDAGSLGMTCVVDCHSYARHNGTVIGSGNVTAAALGDFWGKLAAALKADTLSYAAVSGYDIMNEPHDMPNSTIWPQAAQAAVDAIRAVDSAVTIYVEGNGWSSAMAWRTNNETLNINDPAGKLIYSAHQYMDANADGWYEATEQVKPAGVPANIGETRVDPFVDWCEQYGRKGHIGEWGVPTNDPGWETVALHLMQYLGSKGIPSMEWAAGPWYSSSDPIQMGGPGRPIPSLMPKLEPYFSASVPVPIPPPPGQDNSAVYDFNAGTANAVVDGNITASVLTHAGLAAAPIITDDNGNLPSKAYTTRPNARSKADALSMPSKFECTITKGAAGQRIVGLTYRAARGGSTTGRGFCIRSSHDGYAADIRDVASIPTAHPTFTSYSETLDIALDPGPVTFRFHHWVDGDNRSVNWDDVVFLYEDAPAVDYKAQLTAHLDALQVNVDAMRATVGAMP